MAVAMEQLQPRNCPFFFLCIVSLGGVERSNISRLFRMMMMMLQDGVDEMRSSEVKVNVCCGFS